MNDFDSSTTEEISDLEVGSKSSEEKESESELKEEDDEADENETESSFSKLEVFSEEYSNFSNINPQPAWTSFYNTSANSDDAKSYEDLILQFCICHLPMKKNYAAQCRNYIQLAQNEILRKNYGAAIARYKDFSSFVDNFAVSKAKKDFSTGRVIELKTLANERISLCYLLKDNPQLALRFAQKAIIQKPVVPQSHLWRAIANRRLGDLITALKSITMFGTLTSVSLENCPYQFEEQKIIGTYWRIILMITQQSQFDLKLLHFPSLNLTTLTPKVQEERMAITFLMNFPNYNTLIHADPFVLHLLPIEDGCFIEALQEQKEAFGFKHNDETSQYFAHLPTEKFFSSNAESQDYQKYSSETAKNLWETSAFINSSSCQLSLKPGRGLYEHLLYCHALLKDEKYIQVVAEFESILADLAIFPVLSDEEWNDDLALIVDVKIEMIENAIELLKEHNKKELSVTREIEKIKLHLQLSESRFRAQQRLLAETQSPYPTHLYYRNTSSSLKKKFVGLNKFLIETKTKRNLFPKI